MAKIEDYTKQEISYVLTELNYMEMVSDESYYWRDIDTLRVMETYEGRRLLLNYRLRRLGEIIVAPIKRRIGR